MPIVGIGQNNPVHDLLDSSQGPNTESPVLSFTSASNSTTANRAQGTHQPKRPSSEAVHQPQSSLGTPDIKALDLEAGDIVTAAEPAQNLIAGNALLINSPRTHVGVQSKVANGNARAQSTLSPLNSAKDSSTGPNASTTASVYTPNGRTSFAYGTTTSTPSLGMDGRLGLVSGTQTIPATSDSQDELHSDRILALISSPALGSDTSTSPQTILTSIAPILNDSGSTASLLFGPIATPSTSNGPSPLTISRQTVTINSLGQYFIDNETLTPGGVITVSGSKISLAPNASDLMIGTSTDALGSSVTANRGSGSNGTEVQKFTGYALGARDGLWSSSMILLASFLLMLWI